MEPFFRRNRKTFAELIDDDVFFDFALPCESLPFFCGQWQKSSEGAPQNT